MSPDLLALMAVPVHQVLPEILERLEFPVLMVLPDSKVCVVNLA